MQEIARNGVDALRARLLTEPPLLPLAPTRSDNDLNPHIGREPPRELTPAAVLIPIIGRADPTVLFTRRTEHLSRHAGQISFPGGRVHEDDSSLAATALRETREETGIEERWISLAGYLDAHETITGFAILPVIGLVHGDFRLAPDPREVAETFEVPLAFLLDIANCRRDTRASRGRTRPFHAFAFGRHYIWGATAAIVVSLRERLCDPAAPL